MTQTVVIQVIYHYVGEFGIVYKAHLMKDFSLRVTNNVAVKTLKGGV